MERAGGRCEICGAAGEHVHHDQYWPAVRGEDGRKRYRYGGEPLEWLRLLCEPCHVEHHRGASPPRVVPVEEYREPEPDQAIQQRQTGPLFTRGRSPPPVFRTNYYD